MSLQTRAPRPSGSAGVPGPPPGAPGTSARRRRWPLALAAVLAAAAVLAGALLAFAAVRLGGLHRVAVAGLAPADGSAETILLTGSDSRAGEPAGAAQHFGSAAEVAGQRSDVIILVRLDPAHHRLAMLSIPRDLLVTLPSGRRGRINQSFSAGPSALVATISQNLGIAVNHYAQVDFAGLQALTDAVGGVCMDFLLPVRDGAPGGHGNESGLDVPKPGRDTLHGAMALALVRSRYYEYLAGGRWHAEGTGDLGRIERQHVFLRALLAKTAHRATNPFTALAVLDRLPSRVTLDRGWSTPALMRLGLRVRGLHLGSAPSWTLPTRAEALGTLGDVLVPGADDRAVIAAWAGSTAPAAPSSPATPAPAGRPASGTAASAGASPSAAPLPPWDPRPC